MWNKIIEVLTMGVQDNLVWTTLSLICLFMLYVINSLLGLSMAGFKDEIDWRRFFVSQLKNITIVVCIFAACYALNTFCITVSLIEGIKIDVEIVTALEIIAIVIGWDADLARDILEKLNNFKELKYIKKEDVAIIDKNVASEEIKG